MTIKNNPFRRLGRLLYNARNHQKLSLFEASQRTGISVAKLIAIEDASMKFYEEYQTQTIDAVQSYAQYLEIDAHDLIREVSIARNIAKPAIPTAASLLKK